MDIRLLLITQLIKMGAAAAIAAALVRSKEFKSRLLKENRTLAETVELTFMIAAPFALGVVVRLWVKNFFAADLSLEGVLIIGVMGGRFAGVLGGLVIGLPAAFGHSEWLAIPFDVGLGFAAGVLRQVAANHEDIWSFSPFIDLSIYQWIRRNLPRPRVDWQISFFCIIVAFRIIQSLLARAFPHELFAVVSTDLWWPETLAYATTVVCIAVPLKIWNSARMELKLQEQQRMLMQARMEALQSQINPHFLFNTLNTVSSLVRFDPDMAREIIVKLASILRRLLRTHESFVRLREEMEFIDDYLDIEVVRFGRDKLHVVKDLAPDTLDVVVPSMLLQPLVENSLKHGLSPKVDGGTIMLRSNLEDGRLVIEVADDGVGLSDTGVENSSTGIGMANIEGRLKVLYGDSARMIVRNGEPTGMVVRLDLPLLESAEPGDETAAAAAGMIYNRP